MPKSHTDTKTIEELFGRMTNPDEYSSSERIIIESGFQRGDNENGVWKIDHSKNYIDSILRNFPTGIITLVKDPSYDDKYYVLDGGNRLRAIRDFMSGKFPTKENTYYTELTEREQAHMITFLVPCQTYTILRTDPPDTIADMFTRLNTSAYPLTQGELFKAHGWQRNCWIIEYAKQILCGEDADSAYKFSDIIVSDVSCVNWFRNSWNDTFGTDLKPRKRGENLALVIGLLVSCVNEDFKLFDTRYNNIKKYLPSNICPKEQDMETIVHKVGEFLGIMKQIYSVSNFGGLKMGMPSRNKIAHVLFAVLDRRFENDGVLEKFIEFFF